MRRSNAPFIAITVAAIAICTTGLTADDTSQAAKLFELLELRPDMSVADIGAGSGEMSILMAKRLTLPGRVYSTDINQDRLREIRTAAAREHLDNVTVLEGAEKTTNLPDGCCDAIFIRNVYHHFADPASMNRSVFSALKAGGRLAIIDFVPRSGSDLPAGTPTSRGGHGVTADAVAQEVTEAGFTRVQVIEHWDDSRGMFLLFRKP